MIPQIIANDHHIKAPPISVIKERNRYYRSTETIMIHAPSAAKELAVSLGFKPSRSDLATWLYIPRHVEPHRDSGGHALVYVHSGDGLLGVIVKGRLEELKMTQGDVCIFNDREMHFWFSQDKPCLILCSSIKYRQLI